MTLPPSPYSEQVLPAVHRLLGNLCRVPGSGEEGSFHRQRWLYRFGGGFHPATLQCAVYPLARLYSEEAPGNPFHGNPEILRNIRTILAYTPRLQNADGSFPEWYRGQPSFCATAYLTAFLTETATRIGEDLDRDEPGGVARSVERAAAWIVRHRRGHPANQLAAGLLALQNCAALLGDSWYRHAHATRDQILRSRSAEGWFPEYGGCDPGYQTLTLDFLTRCGERGMDGLDTAVEEGLGFLDRWVFPDGSSPAHLNWRGTNFLMPYAIERRSVRFPPAGRLAARVRGAIRAGLLPTPATVDDRYASHLFLPSFVDAYLCAEPAGVPSSGVANAVPFESRDAGLILAVAGPLLAHIQARRGAFSVSGDGGPAWNDPGYLVRRGRSRYLPEPVECYGYDAGREYRFESSFRLLRGDGTSRPAAAAMAPCASALGGAFSGSFPKAMESWLRSKVFSQGKRIPVRLSRTIRFGAGELLVTDRILAEGAASPYEILLLGEVYPAGTPSSQFFSSSELAGGRFPPPAVAAAVADAWRERGFVERETVVTASGRGIGFLCRVNGREIHPAASVARRIR